jgi:hypothetical protein
MTITITPSKNWSELDQLGEITGVAVTGEGRRYDVKIKKFQYAPGVVTVHRGASNEGEVFLNEKTCPPNQSSTKNAIDTNSRYFEEAWIPAGQGSVPVVIIDNTGWPCGKVVLPK